MLDPDEWSFAKPAVCLPLRPHSSPLWEQVEGREGNGQSALRWEEEKDALQVVIVLAIRAIGMPIIAGMFTQKLFVLHRLPRCSGWIYLVQGNL